MIRAIFYDFDGVIKESTSIKTDAFYDLYLPFGKEIAEKAKEHHINNGGVSRYEKFKIYHKDFLGLEILSEELENLANQFSKIVLKKVIDCPYVAGAKESIVHLDKQLEQFIVTGTPQNEIDVIVSELEISQHFVAVLGSPKSKIQLCQEILDEKSYLPSEVLFIGDATTDYEAATHFGFHFLLREHLENEELFASIKVDKSKNLENLTNYIKQIKP